MTFSLGATTIRNICLRILFSVAALPLAAHALPIPQQIAASAASATPETKTPAPASEQGKFILHKFEQPIGEETYQITSDGNSVAAKIDFKFTDRGTPVPITATFKSSPDLTPQSFEVKGKNSRSTEIDDAVEVQSEKVRLRDREKWT